MANTTHQPSVAIRIRTKISDIERVTKGRHTPRLPFETDWKPPNLKGISQLTLKGEKVSVLLGPRLLTATITASLDEPAVLKIGVWDKQRKLLTSGLLDQKLKFGVGSSAFVLTRSTKQGDLIELELEDARVNALRDFTTKLKAERGTTTRVGFVKQLMQEKGAPDLALYIDTGKQGQITIEKNPLSISTEFRTAAKPPKPSAFAKTKVKGQQADAEQLDNIKTVLGHLYDLGATKDELIMVSMCCTQESSWHNLAGGDRDSVGLFQQRASQGWKGLRNRKAAALEFWTKLKAAEARAPGLEKTLYVAAVQRPDARYNRAYARWQEESTATVSAWNRAYGSTQSVATTKYYEFRRGGLDGTIEDTWQCTGRLADEVQYRRFIVDDVFYFLPDELLIGTGPVLALTEKTEGVRSAIDFDMDTLYEPNTCTFDMHGNKWVAPVGTCIELDDVGPANGVWLVNKITGNLFTPDLVSVECVRPRAVLTEPPADQTDIDAGVSLGGRSTTTTKLLPLGIDGDPFGAVSGTPKGIIDSIAIPLAAANGVEKTPAQNDIDNHNHTHLGAASDHAGPPDVKWAADFGIGPDIRGGGNAAGAARGDRVAAALAARFGIPWHGAGVSSASHDGFRFQLLWRYESAQAGNHYTHVHFGVRREG